MSIGRSLRRGAMVGGLLSVATVAARRAAARRAALRFYDRIGEPGPPRRYGTFYGGPPGVYHQSEATWTLMPGYVYYPNTGLLRFLLVAVHQITAVRRPKSDGLGVLIKIRNNS